MSLRNGRAPTSSATETEAAQSCRRRFGRWQEQPVAEAWIFRGVFDVSIYSGFSH